MKVPLSTVHALLAYAEQQGLAVDALLPRPSKVPRVDAQTWLSSAEVNDVLLKVVSIPGAEAMGHELGLATLVSTHGFWGLGGISQPTGEAGLQFARRFLGLIIPAGKGIDPNELSLHFDNPELNYYRKYKDRLPAVEFEAGFNGLRGPSALLDKPLRAASPVSASLVEQQCERLYEQLFSHHAGFIEEVHSAIREQEQGYADPAPVVAYC